MEWRTTSTMLRELRDFDRGEAWGTFVERFRRPIVAFAGRLGHTSDDAEDIAQETLLAFAEAFRAGRYDQNKGRLSQWLFGIAYKHALKERQRRRRDRAALEPGGDRASFLASIPDEAAATQVWDHEWEAALLDECLAHVRQEVEPATMRAFELTALADRPAADVARELGLSVTAVYNGKHRVVKRLRELREQFDQIA